jgi:cytochrome c-type biogenesis protein CcmH
MMLAVVFALMTAAAVMAVLWPLGRRREAACAEPAGGEAAVYRHQLEEIERERDEGLIGVAEAAAARTEVARRLLAASESAPAAQAGGDVGRRRVAALVGLIGVPVLALGLYASLGRPDLPDRPLAERERSEPAVQLSQLIARVEAELASRPQDGRGWQVIAPVYLRSGRSAEAADAYSRAIRLLGPSAELKAGLGEALVQAADGRVTAEAEQVFREALQLDADLPQAHLQLARAREQRGDLPGAAGVYRALIQSADKGAAWLPVARRALARLALGTDGSVPPVDPSALAGQSPEQRAATIRGMVEGLEGRLRTSPDDLPGHLRLIRAWMMMGESAKAEDAAAAARQAFAGRDEAVQRIDDLMLGLDLDKGPA